jgi:hypothetical protein
MGYASFLSSPLPEFLSEILTAVQYRDDLDVLLAKLIDHTIILDDQLPERFVLDLRHLPPHL